MVLFSKKAKKQEVSVLENGWQFYCPPTTLEPVGTIFRIDDEGRRHIVGNLKDLPITRGIEGATRVEKRLEVGASMLARLLGLGPEAEAKVNLAETVVFELSQPEREYVTDETLDPVLDPYKNFLKKQYRVDNRYFVIRECRWATALILRLSKERVMALGGEAKVNEALAIGAKIQAVNENVYEITSDFPEKMRVTFLPDEITQISAALGGDELELGRVPVRRPLVWRS